MAKNISVKISKEDLKKKKEKVKKHKISKETLLALYKIIRTSRSLDDLEIKMKKQNKAYFQISGAGHEGILAALGQFLRSGSDYFMTYYRDRALCLAMGVTPYEMLCQANGNIGDTSSYGRQMPAHWGNKKANIISNSSCTGTQFLQGIGLADAKSYAQKNKLGDQIPYSKDEIILISTGDGTIAQGEFWESLTTACVHKYPILYLLEDNGLAISTRSDVQIPGGNLAKALKNFPNLKIFECDGNCPIESYLESEEATKYIRSGKGPVLLRATVTRPYSHSLSDDQRFYRDEKELKEEVSEDVMQSYPAFLLQSGLITEKELESIDKEVSAELSNAHKKAIATPWPKKETYLDHLYSEDNSPMDKSFESDPKFENEEAIPMAQAINNVLKSEVKKNPLIQVFGEDVADFSNPKDLKNSSLKGKGGVFKVTSGVQRVGLPGQVFDSPLAEANIVGRAIGMALRGLLPVVEIQFFDYIWTAFMQLKNELATMRYRSGGDYFCPVVIRVAIGGYLRGGAIYHSQCGESIFTHIPGLRVVFPSNSIDAAGLLRTAIRCGDPVIFLEHKHLYYQGYNRSPDPGENFMIPFGKANIVKEGKDLTILCWGALVQKSFDAAKKAKNAGHSVEVIDARTLAPFDMETLKKSVKKTNRLLIAHEEVKTSGFAGEVAARVNEECFEYLDAPIVRITAEDVHVAYCPDLEDRILPQVDDIYEGILKICQY